MNKPPPPPVYYYIDIGGRIGSGKILECYDVGDFKRAVYKENGYSREKDNFVASELQVYLGKKEGKKWVKDGDALEPRVVLDPTKDYFIEVPEKKAETGVGGKKKFILRSY